MAIPVPGEPGERHSAIGSVDQSEPASSDSLRPRLRPRPGTRAGPAPRADARQ